MKIKTLSIYLTLLLSLMVVFSSCEDRLDLSEYDVQEGEGELTLNFTFSDLVKTSIGDSRASGTAIDEIKDVFIAIYNAGGDKLMDYKYLTPDGEEDRYTGKLEVKDSFNKPGDGIEKPDGESDMGWADNEEHTTPSASYTFNMFPFGRYQIYAAANVGNLAYSADEKIREAIQTAEGLKSISYTWQPANIGANNQMFGYFTYADKQTSTGFDAPIVTVSTKVTDLHAWIKRLASKVTIAYNPEGLNENVTIYIHSVTLRDIPQSCYLGQQNPQWGVDDLRGVHYLDLLNRKTVDGGNDDVRVANSYFNYDRNGITTGAVDVTNALRGIKLEKGLVGGASVNGTVIQGSDHSYDADALYFFENIQGDYQGDKPFDKFQQKRGDVDGVGENVTSGVYEENGQPVNDYKDKVPYGTYIEVVGYYDSKNPDNVSQGPIKYRFMLGKNTTYNYDAARNHHYKLTLGFRGWANQPDWHIEYDEPDPGLFLPDTWYLSYLYNQKSNLPIKVSSSCYKIELEITQNHWSPYDESTYNGPDNWPPAEGTQIWPTSIGTTTGENYNFTWAEQVVKGNGGTALNGWTTPQLGFLTLLVDGDNPEDIPTSIFGNDLANDHQFNEGMTAVNAAYNDYYKSRMARTLDDLNLIENPDGRLEAKTVVLPDENNNYIVQPVEDSEHIQDPSQKTVLVPLWTMPKDIIQGSGFSGNNPYEEYPRVANIHVKAYFRTGDTETMKEGDCRIIQPKRITNPKGVWRKSGTTGPFHVTLMEQGGLSAHSNFTPLVSEGSWKAYITTLSNAQAGAQSDFISLSPLGTATVDDDGVVHGKSGSNVDFDINFNGSDGVAVINVEYNGEMSIHKILVREGYEQPVTMGGNQWSTFALYGATARPNTTNEYNVVLTTNPLAFGSYVRRECVTKAILVANNGRTDYPTRYGPMGNLGGYRLWLYEENPNLSDRLRSEWTTIGSGININGRTYNYNNNSTNVQSGTSLSVNGQNSVTYACSILGGRSMGKFHTDEYVYRVPTLKDYKQLADESQFAFGILYGDAAGETANKWEMATGFHDDDNDDDTEESKKGVRGVIVYNTDNAEQIFFSVGRYGMGRRRQYNTSGTDYWGTLWYSDLNAVMAMTGNNWYRPIAY
ncbi:MAG: hypothetical protein K2G40_02440, partial [Muribaculaceae bacterium]|nr:hypothetical protein [Muribaculaceae bacterium]